MNKNHKDDASFPKLLIAIEKNIPIFNEKILNLLIENREVLKMNVPTNTMKIEVQISTKISRY